MHGRTVGRHTTFFTSVGRERINAYGARPALSADLLLLLTAMRCWGAGGKVSDIDGYSERPSRVLCLRALHFGAAVVGV